MAPSRLHQVQVLVQASARAGVQRAALTAVRVAMIQRLALGAVLVLVLAAVPAAVPTSSS